MTLGNGATVTVVLICFTSHEGNIEVESLGCLREASSQGHHGLPSHRRRATSGSGSLLNSALASSQGHCPHQAGLESRPPTARARRTRLLGVASGRRGGATRTSRRMSRLQLPSMQSLPSLQSLPSSTPAQLTLVRWFFCVIRSQICCVYAQESFSAVGRKALDTTADIWRSASGERKRKAQR